MHSRHTIIPIVVVLAVGCSGSHQYGEAAAGSSTTQVGSTKSASVTIDGTGGTTANRSGVMIGDTGPTGGEGGTVTTWDAETNDDAGSTPAGSDAGATVGGATSSSAAPSAATCITSGPAPAEYWQATEVTVGTSGTADVTVDDSCVTQTWEGFGGAFNELGWSLLTTPELQNEAIELLFGTDGAHFALGRIPIGSSDYALNRYTLDDTADPDDPVPNSDPPNRPPPDVALSQFSIDRDTQLLIPYVQAALVVNPNLRLWASPWTPPVWMKNGYKTNSGASENPAAQPSYFDGGDMNGDITTLNAYAQYFVKFIKAYQDKGIAINAVAPQNEPSYAQNFPSCVWDATTYASFVDILGPALTAASLTTNIMLGTMADVTSDSAIVTSVMGDNIAKSYVSVIGVQYGMMANIASYNSLYGLPIWVSEHKCGNYPWDSTSYVTQAPNDQAYAVESWGYIRDSIKAGITAYNAWNMVLDPIGTNIDVSRPWAQNSLLLVSNGSIVKTPVYYVMRHLSQFVKPQAYVVAVSGPGATDAVAFKNPDQTIVTVLFNSNLSSARTSIVQIAGKQLQFSTPANGWATVVSR